jgi:hypothetical protein
VQPNWLGCSPRLIPPLTPHIILKALRNGDESAAVVAFIKQLKVDIAEAQDNLLVAKVTQAEFSN